MIIKVEPTKVSLLCYAKILLSYKMKFENPFGLPSMEYKINHSYTGGLLSVLEPQPLPQMFLDQIGPWEEISPMDAEMILSGPSWTDESNSLWPYDPMYSQNGKRWSIDYIKASELDLDTIGQVLSAGGISPDELSNIITSTSQASTEELMLDFDPDNYDPTTGEFT